MEFLKPSQEWIRKYLLDVNIINNSQFHIGLGLLKVVDNKSLFTEEELRNIDGDPDELSLFSCIVLANIYWKSDCKMLCIKNMHLGIDNGNNEKVENIKPFVSYFS